MSEYIGVRGEIVGCDAAGNPFYNMYLTDEEVIRCRDCKHSGIDQSDHEYRASRWCRLHEMDVRDESFCSWAERRES